MKTLIDSLIGWPERAAQHLGSLVPLFARIVVGWVFLWSGWGKLNNLSAMIENFASWPIPAPHILTPFVSGVEFFGGIFLLLGLLTRVSAGALDHLASAPNRCPRATGVAPYSSQAVPVKHFAPKGLGDGRSADVITIAPFTANLTALAASIPRDPSVTRAT